MSPDEFEPGLEDALYAARVGKGVSRDRQICTLCLVVQYAKPQVKATFEALAAGTISGRALHRALRASGLRITRETIQQHRNEGHTP